MRDRDEEALRSTVAGLIEGGGFRGRRWSWISASGPYFFKIPRLTNSVQVDSSSIRALELAQAEYRSLVKLCEMSDIYTEPVALLRSYACLVVPHVAGVDLRAELLQTRQSEERRLILNKCMEHIALLHAASRRESNNELPPKQYTKVREELRSETTLPRVPTVVVKGIEVRNVRKDGATGKLWFFDPDEVQTGFAEDDVTRFLLSLLMLRWGRHLDCRIWTQFSVRDLVAAYESIAHSSLDKSTLRYCFRSNMEMREHDARREMARMKLWLRPFAWIYAKAFFLQIHFWARHYGL